LTVRLTIGIPVMATTKAGSVQSHQGTVVLTLESASVPLPVRPAITFRFLISTLRSRVHGYEWGQNPSLLLLVLCNELQQLIFLSP
jgi:hypothetical protein